MQFKTSLVTLATALLASLAAASPIAPVVLDVWSPKITSPTNGTVWTIGTDVNVTWTTSDAPVNISNGGAILLDNNGYPSEAGYLAKPINLRQGWATVTVPVVVPGKNYSIVLFGDSGNQGERFEIKAPNVLDLFSL